MKQEVKAELYSLREASTMLGVSISTLRRMIADGRLPKVDIGINKVMIPVDKLNELLKQ